MSDPQQNAYLADELEDLRRMWAEGVSAAEIGEWLGRSPAAICSKACRLKLPARTLSQAGKERCPECGNAGRVAKSGRPLDACPRCAAEAEAEYQQRFLYREAAE